MTCDTQDVFLFYLNFEILGDAISEQDLSPVQLIFFLIKLKSK